MRCGTLFSFEAMLALLIILSSIVFADNIICVWHPFRRGGGLLDETSILSLMFSLDTSGVLEDIFISGDYTRLCDLLASYFNVSFVFRVFDGFNGYLIFENSFKPDFSRGVYYYYFSTSKSRVFIIFIGVLFEG